MSTNSEAFLTAFSQLEKFLRRHAHADAGVGFGKLVTRVGAVVPEVCHYQNDLREFAQLRNAIVHDHDGGRIIAEPRRSTVTAIQKIAAAVTHPPTVGERFKRDVVTVQLDECIDSAAAIILHESFSQLPVMEGSKFHGLLTTNTIARWFGAYRTARQAPGVRTSIREVLHYAEDVRSYAFIQRDTTLARVLEWFSNFETRGCELSALLIADGGEITPRFHGIITVSDLPQIVRSLRVS